MAEKPAPYTFDRVVRMILTALGVIGGVWLIRYLAYVLVPFVAACVLAYVLDPLIVAVNQRLRRRSVAVGATLGGLTVLFFVVTLCVSYLGAMQIERFGRTYQALQRKVTQAGASLSEPPTALEGPKTFLGIQELRQAWSDYRESAKEKDQSERLAEFRRRVSGTLAGNILEELIDEQENYTELVFQSARRVVRGGWVVLSTGINSLLALATLVILTLLFLVFLLLDYPKYVALGREYLPPDYREPILKFLREFDVVLRQYLRGQMIIALAMAALFSIGFSLMGLPLAVPFGLFVGMLNMVPYLQVIALPPGLLLAVFRAVQLDSSILMSLTWFLVVFGIVQIIQDVLLNPTIQGKTTGLQPVAILLGVFIWGKLLGPVGLILAIPFTSLGIAYYRRIVLKHDVEDVRLNHESDEKKTPGKKKKR